MKAVLAVLALLVVVGLGFFLYSTPTAPPEMTEAEIAQIETDVMQIADDWMEVWKDLETDCENAQALLHPDYWVRIPSGEVRDISEWPDYCARSTATRAGFSGDWTDQKVRVISPDAAVFIGTYSPTFSFNDGRPPRHYLTSAQKLLVERTAAGWGISWMSFSNGPSEVVEEG
jgi:hypothetical protein